MRKPRKISIISCITYLYNWLESNSDFIFINEATNTCTAEEFFHLQVELAKLKKKVRSSLTTLSDDFSELQGCINQLRMIIERNKIIRRGR
jgi:hypothetical protein